MLNLRPNPAILRCTVGLSIVVGAQVEAQQGAIAGRITDEGTRQPLGAVWVQVVGTSICVECRGDEWLELRVGR